MAADPAPDTRGGSPGDDDSQRAPGSVRGVFAAGATEQETALAVQMLDHQDGARPIQQLRDWGLGRSAPHAGQVVLDVGAGTGTMKRRLAQCVQPGGSATGVEPNAELRRVASERADSTGSPARFRDGVAARLDVPSASVDLIWCERVLQHMADAGAAIAEFSRVLRPGGCAVVLDSDHSTRIMSDVDRRAEEAFRQLVLQMTANPRAALEIPGQAVAAGLRVDADIGSAALVFGPDVILRTQFVPRMADAVVARGLLTRAEADQAVRSHQGAAQQGRAFSAVTMFGFVLHKP